MYNTEASTQQIAKAYQESWANIEEMFKKHTEVDEVINDVKEGKVKEYVTKLRKRIEPMLNSLAGTKMGNLSIGRGLVRVNSSKFHRRINLWLGGDGDHEWQDFWLSDSQYEKIPTEKDLVFAHPDQIKHLLTELMWRFQPLGNGNGIKSFIVTQKAKTFSTDTPVKVIKIEEETQINDSHWLDTMITKVLVPLDKPKFPLLNRNDGLYRSDEIKKILETPTKVLFGSIEPYFGSGPESIVCVPDLIETSTIGGLEFELLGFGDKSLSATDLEEFIDAVRWKLRLVIELISNAEKTFSVRGKVYKDAYFHKTEGHSDTGPTYPALDNILELTQPPEARTDVVRKLLEKVYGHFAKAKHSGEHWREYQSHTFEVACTVGGVIDTLWPSARKVMIENMVCARGPTLDGLQKELNDEKRKFIPQLFRGLEREKDLFLLPQYRDHFIHSFYCFVLGLILMSKNNVLLSNELHLKDIDYSEKENRERKKEDEDSDRKLLQKWFIISMGHDIAYIMQKGGDVVEKFVLDYLQSNPSKKLMQWSLCVRDLLQFGKFPQYLTNVSDTAFTIHPENLKKVLRQTICQEIVNDVAHRQIQHDIWSSMFIMHSLGSCAEYLQDKYKWIPTDLDAVGRAILPHHVLSWNDKEGHLMNLLRTDDSVACEVDWNPRINKKDNPMGYLLFLCDTISQAGRLAPELNEGDLDIREMKFQKIEVTPERLHIELNYVFKEQYDDDKITEELIKAMNNHYDKPFVCLGLEQSNAETISVVLSSDRPIKVISVMRSWSD